MFAASPDPTPEQIAERAAEIRAGWTEEQWRLRSRLPTVDEMRARLAGCEVRMIAVEQVIPRRRRKGVKSNGG